MNEDEPASYIRDNLYRLGSGIVTTLSLISGHFILIGSLAFILEGISGFQAGRGGLVSGWVFIIGLLFLSMLIGWFLYIILRFISLLRGMARWYWMEKTPPFYDESSDLEEYISLPAGNFKEDVDIDQVKKEFLNSTLYGVLTFLVGVLISIFISAYQEEIRPFLENRPTLDLLVQGVSYIFQAPINLLSRMNIITSSDPLNALLLLLSVGFPALFFAVSSANLSELLENRYFEKIYNQVIGRDFYEIPFISWILLVGVILSTRFIVLLILPY